MIMDRHAALEILRQLIRIRTPQPVGDELDAVKYIASLLSGEMFENRILYHGNNRASLISEIRGRGEGPKVALFGNLDTVGLEDIDSWEHPPFAADYEGGRVFGRGATNDKGGVTAILLTALALAERGTPPERDVAFCFTADNDRGAIGATAMLESGFFDGIQEILFAQPTNCGIGIGQKGLLWLDVEVRGVSSHVTKPSLSVNAFTAFAEFYKKIEALFRDVEEHPLFGSPLCSITRLSASGPTCYSIPDRATGRIDIRFPPKVDADRLHKKIGTIADEMTSEEKHLEIRLETMNKRSAIGMTDTAPIVKKLKRIYKRQKISPTLIGLPYFTDASVIIPRLGVPFAIVGPGVDIYGKHGDESIALDDVLTAASVYLDFVSNG
ncbi:M20/M25/M40 family metallo-hydrolase [Synergistaceae bacterium OttesenSCG-928-I11]|nr:M20/M25/M40 family metallo-hydrolase [Synergistaceae bacterium OttesenSCG-928-I11]